MDLREGEQIMKVFHHHPTPFVLNIFKVIAATFPFFLLLFIFQEALPSRVNLTLHLIVITIFALVVTYMALIYWLDKLVITNQRAIYIDWKYLTVRDESEALLDDIQDIQTKEKGLLSYFYIFDYGTFTLETASSHVTLKFPDAPDPEGIRRYVYHIRQQ